MPAWLCLFANLLLVPLLALAPTAFAQEVIVHDRRSVLESGDGGPGDADGAENGVIVWQSGAVHVVNGGFDTLPSTWGPWEGRLMIQPGAIVKIAEGFAVDSLGNVTRWSQPRGFLMRNAEVRGVTITDIRDDTIGGDTNQDGSATAPSRIFGLGLAGEGAVLEGSTVRYVATFNVQGPAQVVGNTLEQTNVRCIPGSAPLVRDNMLDVGTVDMRGCMGVVENNTFVNAGSILIGPAKAISGLGPWFPQTGTVIVAGNQMEGPPGVDVSIRFQDTRSGTERGLDHVAFRALVLNNVMRGHAGIQIPADADALVSGNELTSASTPLVLGCSGCTTSRVVVRGNRFNIAAGSSGSSIISVPRDVWSVGMLVDAENNYWGDASGPFDRSDADSLLNLRGKGWAIGDGIDYVPFIGGTPEEGDDLHILVTASDEAPFEPGRFVTIDIEADRLRLNTAAEATLYATVRAGAGEILEGTEMRVDYTHETAELPPIRVEVPAGTNYLTVSAQLAPDDSRTETFSNEERFEVKRPKNAFDIWTTEVVEVGTGTFPAPVAGDPLHVRLKLGYTLTTSSPTADGRIEIYADARVAGTSNVLQAFPAGGGPLAVLTAPPGTGHTVETELEMTMPLWDVVDQPLPVELHGKILMRDDGGEIVARAAHSVSIERAAAFGPVAFAVGFVDLDERLVPLDQGYFDTTAWPAGFAAFTLIVRSKTAAGWRVQAGGHAQNAAGRVLDVYSDGDVVTGIDGPSPGAELYSVELPRRQALGRDARRFRNILDLVTPGGVRAATVSTYLDVLSVEERLTQPVPAGPSQVLLDAVDATLDVSSNQQAGTVTAAVIDEPYAQPGFPPGASGKTADYTAWQFISLNHYWALHSTLLEGTFAALVRFAYDPATDFPADPGFVEDSLVVAGLNPLSGALEVLPSTLDKAANTVSTDYSTFFETYVVAAKRTVDVQTATEAAAEVPKGYALEPNYPNPFNPTTTLVFHTPATGQVQIVVYDVLGRAVSRLAAGFFPAGVHHVSWDGRDDMGLQVPSGAYFVRMQAGRFSQVRSAMLIR